MSTKKDLTEEKNQLMDEMLDYLSSWDESVEEALQIVEKNRLFIESMQNLDKLLTNEELKRYNQAHQEKWEELIKKQKELRTAIFSRKDILEKQLVQMGRKDKIVSNYIRLQKESVFIEKDY